MNPLSSPITAVGLPRMAAFYRAYQGHLLMALSLVFFTANALIIRWVGFNGEASTWTLVFFRAIIGLIVIVLVYGPRGRLHLGRVVTRPALVARGIIGITGVICYYWTIPRLGAGVATLIGNTYVVFGALFAAWILREKLTLHAAGWFVVSLVGVGLLTQAEIVVSSAIAVSILGALSAGVVLVIIRFLHRTESTGTIFASQCFYGLLVTLPLVIPTLATLTGSGLTWTLTAAFLATFGQLTLTESLRHLSVSASGAINITLPVWITLGAFLLFDERLTALQCAGACLVLLGCARPGKR